MSQLSLPSLLTQASSLLRTNHYGRTSRYDPTPTPVTSAAEQPLRQAQVWLNIRRSADKPCMRTLLQAILASIMLSTTAVAGVIWEVTPSTTIPEFTAPLNSVVDCQVTNQGALELRITSPSHKGQKEYVRCIVYTLPTQADKIDSKLVLLGKPSAIRTTHQRSTTAIFNIPANEVANTLIALEYTDGEKDGMTICRFSTIPCSLIPPSDKPNKSL